MEDAHNIDLKDQAMMLNVKADEFEEGPSPGRSIRFLSSSKEKGTPFSLDWNRFVASYA